MSQENLEVVRKLFERLPEATSKGPFDTCGLTGSG